jgi:hypothetical protein
MPAALMYSAIDSGALKCILLVLARAPLSWKHSVASWPSWWKSETLSLHQGRRPGHHCDQTGRGEFAHFD